MKRVKPQEIQVLIYHQFRERTYSLIFLFKVSHVVNTNRQEVHCSKAAKPHDTRKEEEKRAAHSQYWSQLFKDICWIQFLSISTAKVLLEPRIGTLKKGSCGEHRAMNMQNLSFRCCLRVKARHQWATGYQWFCYLCILHPWCIKIPKVQNNIIIMPCIL